MAQTEPFSTPQTNCCHLYAHNSFKPYLFIVLMLLIFQSIFWLDIKENT